MHITFINVILLIIIAILLYYWNVRETFADTSAALEQLVARDPQDMYEIGGLSPNSIFPYYYPNAYYYPYPYAYDYPYYGPGRRRFRR